MDRLLLPLGVVGALLLALAGLPTASAVIDGSGTCQGAIDGNCYHPVHPQFCWLYVEEPTGWSACVREAPPVLPNFSDDLCDALPPHVCGP